VGALVHEDGRDDRLEPCPHVRHESPGPVDGEGALTKGTEVSPRAGERRTGPHRVNLSM
jgi:hypothetical protein